MVERVKEQSCHELLFQSSFHKNEKLSTVQIKELRWKAGGNCGKAIALPTLKMTYLSLLLSFR